LVLGPIGDWLPIGAMATDGPTLVPEPRV